MAWFSNQYECPCGESWTDEWSCTCNDKCPSCNKEIEPSGSEDLSIIVCEVQMVRQVEYWTEPAPSEWRVMASPPTAEHNADYRCADFETKAEADAFAAELRECDQEQWLPKVLAKLRASECPPPSAG